MTEIHGNGRGVGRGVSVEESDDKEAMWHRGSKGGTVLDSSGFQVNAVENGKL